MNKKKFIFILTVILVICMVIYIILARKMTSSSPKENVLTKVVTPSEVMYPSPTKIAPTIPVFPTDIVLQLTPIYPENSSTNPASLGGITLNEAAVKKAESRQDLVKKLPVESDSFIITYDFDYDKFLVKTKAFEAKDSFWAWLAQNYPSVSEDNFIFH